MKPCDLKNKKCVPCEGGVKPLKNSQLEEFLKAIDEEWYVHNEHDISRTFTFKNFRQALEFGNVIGEIAEEEGHHPDMTISWGKVKVLLWTHAIDGLSENDFILAAKLDEAYNKIKERS